MQHVITKAVITEKSMGDAGKGTFTFAVLKSATKEQIRKAVQQNYNVHVTKITTINVKGKTKRFGPKRLEQKLTNWKKAMVTVKKGEKIELFDLGS